MDFKFANGSAAFVCPGCVEKSWRILYDRERGIGAIPQNLAPQCAQPLGVARNVLDGENGAQVKQESRCGGKLEVVG
ncbi:MAG TPA: hypothetical protein VNF29_05055 [Candidatus Binataceae bacterium]|nr:hypothetical protein [Candidatus Binataceae bacterium]HVA80272.1 hypothetical protein [Candidatus Binataceae bacterium]